MNTAAPPTEHDSTLDLAALAAQTRTDRNRAVDLYRVIAMLAVAVGHWLAMVAITRDGELVAGNALEYVPVLAWATWLLQVMPLFFVVGGFSSAMSLDAHDRNAGRSQDWVAARLRRMLPPAVVLAATWLAVIAVGAFAGHADLAITGAHAAAIPLWFLANYTIDTALAPFVLPRFRANKVGFSVLIVGAFVSFETMRIVGVPVLPHINWVLGWLSFQILGMAWRDGLLPSGRHLVAVAAGFWVAAFTAVLSGGPWAISMVNFPGMENSPTNPPTLGLMLFGVAYSLTAMAAAPTVSRALEMRTRAWAVVVGANTVAMSVYLWHMTAAVIVIGALHGSIGLPAVVVGSASWWIWKLPIIAASTVVLAGIVTKVARYERDALLAPRRPWNGGVLSIVVAAAVTSAALKFWTSGQPLQIVASCSILVMLGLTVFRPNVRRTAPV